MTEYTGKNLYVKFGSTVLSSRFKSYNESDEAGMVDKSAGADTRRTYLATLADGGATMELLQESLGTALWAAIAPGTEGTLEWGPEGTASGKPKYTVDAIIKSRKRNLVHDDVVKVTIDIVYNTGTGVTSATY